jgi:hypothetical protein
LTSTLGSPTTQAAPPSRCAEPAVRPGGGWEPISPGNTFPDEVMSIRVSSPPIPLPKSPLRRKARQAMGPPAQFAVRGDAGLQACPKESGGMGSQIADSTAPPRPAVSFRERGKGAGSWAAAREQGGSELTSADRLRVDRQRVGLAAEVRPRIMGEVLPGAGNPSRSPDDASAGGSKARSDLRQEAGWSAR